MPLFDVKYRTTPGGKWCLDKWAPLTFRESFDDVPLHVPGDWIGVEYSYEWTLRGNLPVLAQWFTWEDFEYYDRREPNELQRWLDVEEVAYVYSKELDVKVIDR
jgi:hypothetical protein